MIQFSALAKTHGSSSKVTHLYSTPRLPDILPQSSDLAQQFSAASSIIFILESAPNTERKESAIYHSQTVNYLYTEGEIEVNLDSSEMSVFTKGDLAVQQAYCGQHGKDRTIRAVKKWRGYYMCALGLRVSGPG